MEAGHRQLDWCTQKRPVWHVQICSACMANSAFLVSSDKHTIISYSPFSFMRCEQKCVYFRDIVVTPQNFLKHRHGRLCNFSGWADTFRWTWMPSNYLWNNTVLWILGNSDTIPPHTPRSRSSCVCTPSQILRIQRRAIDTINNSSNCHITPKSKCPLSHNIWQL